jgi:hypothetical protein
MKTAPEKVYTRRSELYGMTDKMGIVRYPCTIVDDIYDSMETTRL